jgi:hypothetical protein
MGSVEKRRAFIHELVGYNLYNGYMCYICAENDCIFINVKRTFVEIFNK